jgi:hypothetical protein
MKRQQENSLKELEALQRMLSFAPFATSERRGWKGMQAARYRKNAATVEFGASATMHMLVLTIQPAEKMDLRCEGVGRDIPLPPGSIMVVPAGSSVERAQQLLRTDGELGLAEVALRVGFSDQSKFSLHFKRIVGVTPGRFRTSAR